MNSTCLRSTRVNKSSFKERTKQNGRIMFRIAHQTSLHRYGKHFKKNIKNYFLYYIVRVYFYILVNCGYFIQAFQNVHIALEHQSAFISIKQ